MENFHVWSKDKLRFESSNLWIRLKKKKKKKNTSALEVAKYKQILKTLIGLLYTL